MQYQSPSYAYIRNEDGRNLLLPLLFCAAVGFPFGYIASNTNKNNQQYYPTYQQPYYIPYQPMPYYPPYPYYGPYYR